MKRLAHKYIGLEGGAAHQSAIKIIGNLEKAYWLACNSATGLSYCCDETATTMHHERELEEAKIIFRAI